MMRATLIALPLLLVATAAAYWVWVTPRLPSAAEIREAYGTSLPPATDGLAVFHLGHSLVNRDMPAMLAQLAGDQHRYHSQLGWGTSLKQHWEPGEIISGFDTENDHPRFRPAREAVGSGDYDAVVLTEMVELKDAVRYHDSTRYFGRWAELARGADPRTQVYLYETWHNLGDPGGWLNRLDGDLADLWERRILLPDLARSPDRPPRVIPAGQVLARLVREIEAQGGLGAITRAEDLFGIDANGQRDLIHLNDIGNYLVALTHYAVLYRRSPVGLPYRLARADGTQAQAPAPEVAALMQQVVWDVVTSYPKTGVGK